MFDGTELPSSEYKSVDRQVNTMTLTGIERMLVAARPMDLFSPRFIMRFLKPGMISAVELSWMIRHSSQPAQWACSISGLL